MARLKPDVRRQLEGLISDGLDDEPIAKKLGLAPRTIASNRRRLLAEAPDNLANLAHWRTLKEAAERLVARVAMPTAETITTGAWLPSLERGDRDDMVLRALRDHMRAGNRGRPFNAWEDQAKRLETAIQKAVAVVRAKLEPLTPRGAATVVEWACTDEDPDKHLSRDERLLELLSDGSVTIGKARDQAELESLDKQVHRLLMELPRLHVDGELREVWKEADQRARECRETLWELSFMERFPGQCRLCPIPLTGRRHRRSSNAP